MRSTTALAIGICLVALAYVAPISPLTPLTYVAVHGDSMHPAVDSGDLVVLRRSDTYGVGDVVAFRDPNLDGAVIMHRIVGRDDHDGQDGRDGGDGRRFRTRGDNNDFVDEYRPGPAEILGLQVLRIPAGADIARRTAHPAYVGLVAAVGSSLVLPALVPRRNRRTHRNRRSHRDDRSDDRSDSRSDGRTEVTT